MGFWSSLGIVVLILAVSVGILSLVPAKDSGDLPPNKDYVYETQSADSSANYPVYSIPNSDQLYWGHMNYVPTQVEWLRDLSRESVQSDKNADADNSPEDCMALCNDVPGCMTSNWDESKRKCQLTQTIMENSAPDVSTAVDCGHECDKIAECTGFRWNSESEQAKCGLNSTQEYYLQSKNNTRTYTKFPSDNVQIYEPI